MSPASESNPHPRTTAPLVRRLTFPTFSGTTPHETLYIVVIAAAGALLLFLLGALCCCCRRRRRKKRQAREMRHSALLGATDVIRARQGGDGGGQVYARSDGGKEQEQEWAQADLGEREMWKEGEYEQREYGYGYEGGQAQVEAPRYQGQYRSTHPSPPPFSSYATATSDAVSFPQKAAVRPELLAQRSASSSQGAPTVRPPHSQSAAGETQSALYYQTQPVEVEPPTPTSMHTQPSVYSTAPPTPTSPSMFASMQSSRASLVPPSLAPGLAPGPVPRVSGPRSTRIAQQRFAPARPEELAVAPGERLVVLQTFADGWCLVARNGIRRSLLNAIFPSSSPSPSPSSPSPNSYSYSNNSLNPDSAPEARRGFVPEWVFLKPVKGLRAERPERVESAGDAAFDALRCAEDPRAEEGQQHNRLSVMSWSRYA